MLYSLIYIYSIIHLINNHYLQLINNIFQSHILVLHTYVRTQVREYGNITLSLPTIHCSEVETYKGIKSKNSNLPYVRVFQGYIEIYNNTVQSTFLKNGVSLVVVTK